MAKDVCYKEKCVSSEYVRLISYPDYKCGMNFQWMTSSSLSAHTVRELTVGFGCILQTLHAVVCMAELNAVTLNGGVICHHRFN